MQTLVCLRMVIVETNDLDSKQPAEQRKRRRDDFDGFACTEIAAGQTVIPDLDVSSSRFGGETLPPDRLADIWRETSSARRWRQTLWLAIGFGVVVGSVLTGAFFLLLPAALRALTR